MIIVGAKGLGKEVLEIFTKRMFSNDICFFDNVSLDLPHKIFERFSILRSIEEVREYFARTGDYSFTLGLGNPVYRFKLCKLFEKEGGVLKSAIGLDAHIGQYGIKIDDGCTILDGVVITSSVSLGKGCLINPNATVSHDAVLGDFVEVSPGSSITGGCLIGSFTMLGTHSVVLPKVKIGRNVIVGAGAVVTKDVPDNSVVTGIPAVIARKLDPLHLDRNEL